jgi:PAS domain S-box-containing protein
MASPTKNPDRGISYAAACGVLYAVAGLAWIFYSDRLLASLYPAGADTPDLQLYKGSAFVLLSALVLYLLVRQAERRSAGRQSDAASVELLASGPAGAGKVALASLPILGQLLLLVLAVGAPMCALLVASLYQGAEIEVANGKRLVESLARITARDTARTIADTERSLSAMARRPLVRTMNPSLCDPILNDVPIINTGYIDALIFNVAGEVVCSVRQIPPGTELRFPKSDAHRRILAGARFVLSEPGQVDSGEGIAVLASVPVRGEDGLVAGSLSFAIDLEAFRPAVRPALPGSGVVGLMTRDGIVVYGENPARRGRDGRDSEIVRLILSRLSSQPDGGEAMAGGFDGAQRFYHYLPVEGTNWIAVAGLPASEIYGQARARAWRGGLTGLAIIALAALAGTWISRRIALPIRSIAGVARRVADGDTGARAPEGGSREAVEVARQFNRMLDVLPLIEEELRESEQRYKGLFETSPECIFVHADGRIVMINPAGARLYGASSPMAMVGKPILELAHPADREIVAERLHRVTVQRLDAEARELRNVRLDGSTVYLEVMSRPLEYMGAPAVITQVRDITARKLAEARVKRLSGFLAAVSQSNAAMTRERTREGLCREICRIIVEKGGFVTAALRLYDEQQNAYVPVATHGPVLDWVGERSIGVDEKNSRVVQAIDSKKVLVLDDVRAEASLPLGQADMLRLGIHSMAALPLIVGDRAIGGLSVFAAEAGVFDAELIALLEELAGNLSFAFDKLDAEQAMQDSEARYRALVDTSPDAIAVLLDGLVVMANKAALTLYRAASLDDLLGKPGIEMLHPDYRTEVLRILARLATDPGTPIRSEVKHLRQDGSAFDAEVVRTYFEYRGKRALQIIVRDISARKEAERRILRLSRLYATLSRTSAAIARAGSGEELCATVCQIAVEQGGLATAFVGLLEQDGRRSRPVGAHGRLSGLVGEMPIDAYEGAAAQGLLATALREGRITISNELLDDPRAEAARANIVETGARAQGVFPLWNETRLIGALSVYANEPGFFDHELISLLQEMAQNISFGLAKISADELHRASEAALRDSEARYRRLFNTTPLCIYVRQDDRVVLINPAGVALLGARSADEIIGLTVWDIVHPDYHELMERRLRHVNEEGKPVPATEFRNLRVDGTAIDTESIVTPFEFQGRPAVQVIVTDISARKAAERAMRRLNAELEQRVQQRTAELQKVNQELSEFSYIVSHDLKAPLRGIASLVGWLEQDYGENLGPEGRELLRLMSARSRRMHRLIEDILHFSRLGRARESSGAIALDKLVREVVDSLDIPAHIEVSQDALPVLRGDETRLRQVFQNLISNAVKFMDRDQGGRIEIGCEAVEEPAGRPDRRAIHPDDAEAGLALESAATRPMWRFFVQDNGPGIEVRHHQRIFEIFQTLAPREDPDSTGIGLTVVKKIIDLMGGRIWVESEIGKGARFVFTLPRRDETQG